MSDLEPAMLKAVSQLRDHLRDSLTSFHTQNPPTQADCDALRAHMERELADMSPDTEVPHALCWPKVEGLAAARCRDHGPCEPLNVEGSMWCPRCLEDPHFILDGDTIVGPSHEVQPEAPVNFITIKCTVTGSSPKPTAPEVRERFAAYYAKHPGKSWGVLTGVLKDGLVNDASVTYSLEIAQERGDTEGEALARILLRMSKTQRRKIGATI